jgi:DNA polymerase I-like protein with 3'-5' exonuclease and polymerase domains
MKPPVTTLDFETEAIAPWPDYPPAPVGLAVRLPNGDASYMAWGHPTGNNCTREDVARLLASVWDGPMLFHNSAFDVAVAMRHFGLPYPQPTHVHDTMFMLFLHDPHAPSMALKPAAERLLGLPPDEQRELEQWIRTNVRSTKDWGAYISQAPADLVGRYAIGDVDRTAALFDLLYPALAGAGMLPAYEREQRLQPILLRGTTRGIRVDVEALAADAAGFQADLLRADQWLRTTLHAPDLNVDSGEELADALDRAGMAHGWQSTPTGKRSTSREALRAAVRDPAVLAMLAYRNSMATCLGTFVLPWLEQAGGDGRCHPAWNQVRGADYGTRTGRLSSSNPNFQNVPNSFNLVVPEGFGPLPRLRRYLLPEPGHVWLKRDYSQQELRVLGHFEDGQLCAAYNREPALDVHGYAADLIRRYTGHTFDRRQTKIVSFTLVYGGGIPALAAKLEAGNHEAGVLKDAYLSAMPDVRKLMQDVKDRGRRRLPVRTTGGRLLYAEPPRAGREQSFKLLNHLIQGSSADMTKEAIVRWDAARLPQDEFLATVHDEINISAPVETAEESMTRLREAMASIPLDVPLLSEGFRGANWQELEAVE